jgi:gliding motility-associated-like protein
LLATHSTNGQSDQTEVSNINILDVPFAAFNVNTELIYAPDTELKLLNFSSRAETYLWSFGDGDSSALFEPEHTYQSEGSYQIKLLAGIDHGSQDINGDGVPDRSLVCYDTAQIVVSARNGGYIKIPNAFSPAESGPTGGHGMSGDNDVFLPIMQGVKTYKMQIFDRWGTKIFETNNPDVGWDGYNKSGSLMSAGVYVYKIEVTLSDGSNDTRMGDVGLIR